MGSDKIRAMQLDGGYLYIAGNYLAGAGDGGWRIEKRAATDGLPDNTFGTSGVVTSNPSGNTDTPRSIAVDGSYIYICGDEIIGFDQQWRIEKRSKSDGALVVAFDTDGFITESSGFGSDSANEILVDSNYVYICGYFVQPDFVSTSWRIEKRDKTTGAFINEFGSSGTLEINSGSGQVPYSMVKDINFFYIAGVFNILADTNWKIEGRGLVTGTNGPRIDWVGTGNYISDGLHPETGEDNASYTFNINYFDEDNDAPGGGYPKLHIIKGISEITGSPFVMSETDPLDVIYGDGKEYSYTKAGLSSGNDFQYYFEAYDSNSAIAVGLSTASKSGPAVTARQLSDGSASDLNNVITYPNPAATAGRFVFTNLTAKASIAIYTISGELFRSITENDGDGNAEWDMKNDSGEAVSRGMYIYLITNNNGEKKSGKIAVK